MSEHLPRPDLDSAPQVKKEAVVATESSAAKSRFKQLFAPVLNLVQGLLADSPEVIAQREQFHAAALERAKEREKEAQERERMLRQYNVYPDSQFVVTQDFISNGFKVFEGAVFTITSIQGGVDFKWKLQGYGDGYWSAYTAAFIDFITTGKIQHISS